ncbi:hypothetical protein [Nitrosopumilus zosterae]|nr:hypothetical protein [Nitrosopumilus zosterae]
MSSPKQLFSLAKLELSAQDDPLKFSGIKSQETKTAYTKSSFIQ